MTEKELNYHGSHDPNRPVVESEDEQDMGDI